MESMRSTAPGLKEYELDAVAKYVYYRNGAQGERFGQAFRRIRQGSDRGTRIQERDQNREE